MISPNLPTVKISELEFYFNLAKEKKISILLLGHYGCGKSSSVYEYGKKIGYEVVDIKLSQFDAVSIRGIPDVIDVKDVYGIKEVKDKMTVWNMPYMFAYIIYKLKGKAILFLDEIDKARDDVASATYELLLQRRYGEYVLPDDTLIICAGNYETDDIRSLGFSAPQVDRLFKLQISDDIDEWIEWAKKNGVDNRVIHFLKNHPNLLWRQYDAEKLTTTSKRTWTMAGWLIKGIDDTDKLYNIVGGCVGSDLANLFITEVADIEGAVKRKEYERIKSFEKGMKREIIDYLISITVENNKVELENGKNFFIWLNEYLNKTDDIELVVVALATLKSKITESYFANLIKVIEWEGKEEFLKKIKNALKSG
jgi:MoxR-like ATPase